MKTLISKEQIDTRLDELALLINKDYADTEELVVIGILNGSFIFCADLVRRLKLPIHIEFMSVSSYVGTESSGELKIHLDLRSNVKGKDVLLVEDIVDTGHTMVNLMKHFKGQEVKSLKLASLLLKRVKLKHKIDVDYLGFEIDDHFVIGYGLDFDGRYRELPYIGIYNND